MASNLKIIRKWVKGGPLACLLFPEGEKLPENLVKEGFLFDYKDYIESQAAIQNNLIYLPIPGETVIIQLIKTRTDEKDYELSELVRQAGSKLFKELKKKSINSITLALPGNDEYLPDYAEGFLLTDYEFTKYKSSPRITNFGDIFLVGSNLKADWLQKTEILSRCVKMCRDLVNEPASFLTARQLSKEIESIAKDSGFQLEVFNKQKIEALKMGGLLAVNKGSKEPPTFNILEWKPAICKNSQPIVLVGKGIVFDTGGLSLKSTTDSMDRMKSDMAGAAVVVGILAAVANLKLPVHVIGLIPATDNRPGENAYMPGDVIRMYNGTTVEVLNTDAEGRLILADALSYAGKFDPELVIDIATLTGAASAATGRFGIVAFEKNCKEDFRLLKKSGKDSFERIVKFPLWKEYKEMIESDIADLKNIGGKDSGAITAAKFLECFTNYPWIHLDIAGVAFLNGSSGYISKGGTGTGVRLIVNFLIRKYELLNTVE